VRLIKQERDANKLINIHALNIIKKEYIAVAKHFNLSKTRAFLRHIKAKEKGIKILKGELFLSLKGKDKDKLLFKLIIIEGIILI
jgi:predicted peroxiredoxin